MAARYPCAARPRPGRGSLLEGERRRSRLLQHVARRLGEKSYPVWPRSDLLRGWADRHRDKFADIRDKTWAQAIFRPQPFPEIRHFK